MSSLVPKKVVRTYSRQRKSSLYEDGLEEQPTKRRRIMGKLPQAPNEGNNTAYVRPYFHSTSCSPARNSSAPPSSPAEAAHLFSDDAPRSSPPSSPLPQCSSPPTRRRKPMFLFAKRNSRPAIRATQPLSERSHNLASSSQKGLSKTKKLVQMQLDLVVKSNKTCNICGMEYVPSLAEDATLHHKFHAMNVGGVDISKAMSKRLRRNQVWSGGEQSFITVVSRRDALAARKTAKEVLNLVNTELGAVPITDEALWSQMCSTILSTKSGSKVPGEKAPREHTSSDRYRVYLYIQGAKCVGACLAERIQCGYPVLEQRDQDDAVVKTAYGVSVEINSSSVSISGAQQPAILGISRIWTSNLHRRQGVASSLLNSARLHFLYGMTVGKEQVAFSQPTESGARLARKWFGQEAGWLAYVE